MEAAYSSGEVHLQTPLQAPTTGHDSNEDANAVVIDLWDDGTNVRKHVYA